MTLTQNAAQTAHELERIVPNCRIISELSQHV